jgi:hypothetical protein
MPDQINPVPSANGTLTTGMTDADIDAVLEHLASLSEYIEPERISCPLLAGNSDGTGERPGDRPGDAFNQRASWDDILRQFGWQARRGAGERTYWRRPGKDDHGWSATTGHCKSETGGDLLYVFSSNAHPFEMNRAYSKFSAYAILAHQGNWQAASRDLQEKGFGPPPVQRINTYRSGNTSRANGTTPAPAKPKLAPAPPYRPFPTEFFPQPARDYIEQSAVSLNVDPSFLALPALAVLAGAIGNSRAIRLWDTWTEPPIIWTAVVADSGTLKSPALEQVIKVLFRCQNDMKTEYTTALAKWETEKETARTGKTATPPKPTLRRILVSDITIEKLSDVLRENPRWVVIARDELSGWFKSFTRYKDSGGSDLPNWLSLHRAGGLIVDRKSGDVKTTIIPRAGVSICGTIQPAILERELNQEAHDAGLASRILMVRPPKHAKKRPTLHMHKATVDAWTLHVSNLLKLAFDPYSHENAPLEVELSDAADTLWWDFYEKWAEEQQAADGALAAAFAKLEGYTARFALLHHVCSAVEDASIPIDKCQETSMTAAIQLTEWFAAETRRIYAEMGESKETQTVRRLAEWIRLKGGEVSPWRLQDALRSRYRNREEAKEALDTLVEVGLGEWISPQAKEVGRPAGPIFRLHSHRGNGKTGETPPDAKQNDPGAGMPVTGETPIEPQKPRAPEGFPGFPVSPEDDREREPGEEG